MTETFGPEFMGRKIPNGVVAWRQSKPRRNGETTFGLSLGASAQVLRHLTADKAPTMEFLASLTQEQLDLFIETSVDGDGWRRGKLRFFGQNVGPRLDAFLAACALAGQPTTYSVDHGRVGHLGFQAHATVTLGSRTMATPIQKRYRPAVEVEYDGVVWCPAMPEHHNWLARRDGAIYFTGNTDQHFETEDECRIMADLITLRQLFTYRTDSVTIPGYPGIQVDDQVRLYERTSEEMFLHYVTGIQMSWDLKTGKYIYQLSTHWLGDVPFSNWTFDPADLSQVTKDYLQAMGRYAP